MLFVKNHRITGWKNARRHRFGILSLLAVVASLGCLGSRAVRAQDVQNMARRIFILDSQGTPVEMTGVLAYQEGHVYSLPDELVANLAGYPANQAGALYNPSGQYVGYTTLEAIQ